MEGRISGTTTMYGLIGSPVSHSGSPAMYNYSFQKRGVDSVYLAWEVKEDQVADFIKAAKLMKIKGFNITMPCKMETARLVDDLSPAAQLIGAVNTVVIKDGKLTGHITDGKGFILNLQDKGVSIRDKSVVLMGGGGAGTAIFVQAALDGAKEIYVFNRKASANFEKLEKIAGKLSKMVPECKISICDLSDEPLLYDTIRKSDILVNATNVGMAPNSDETLIHDMSAYHKDLVVAEIIYNPKETKMMEDAKTAGVKTIIGGKGMLLWQAVEAFRIYTGQEMPVEEVKALFFAE